MDFSAIALDGIASINGGSGNDTIIGSAGADRIIGGSGADILTGGDGADVFAYLFRTESGRGVVADIITDFVSGVDKIDLTAVDANALIEGLQSFTFIGTDAFTDVGQLRVGLDTNGQVALFGNISGSLTPEMQITLTGAPPIVVTDLIL
jgi:Ca2+-binding RTX toxin-like protein